jgi:hypothetical protein
LSEALERLLPFLTFAAMLTAGWFWFVQPRLAVYLRARTDAAALEERVRTLQQASSRTRSVPPADLSRTQREFEQRVASEDRVAEVAAAIAKAVLASAPAGGLRAFVIDAGDRVAAPRGGGAEGDGADPRMSLFPYAVSYTPLRVSFESGFETAGDVLWQLRDLPTTVEVRAATLERGLPLMKTELVIRVLQRSDVIEVPAGAVPESSAAPAPGPTAPRLGAPAPDQKGAR